MVQRRQAQQNCVILFIMFKHNNIYTYTCGVRNHDGGFFGHRVVTDSGRRGVLEFCSCSISLYGCWLNKDIPSVKIPRTIQLQWLFVYHFNAYNTSKKVYILSQRKLNCGFEP